VIAIPSTIVAIKTVHNGNMSTSTSNSTVAIAPSFSSVVTKSRQNKNAKPEISQLAFVVLATA
jgi:hypothetical protein